MRLQRLESIGSPFTMPGISTERLHLFLAPYAAEDRTGIGGGLTEKGEQVFVEEVALAELAARARAGALADSKTLVLVQALQLYRPDLFLSVV